MTELRWPPPGGDDVYTVEEIHTERVSYELRAASHEDAKARYVADGRRIAGSSVSEQVVTWRHPREGEPL